MITYRSEIFAEKSSGNKRLDYLNYLNLNFILRLFKLYSRKDSIIAYSKISFSKNSNHRNQSNYLQRKSIDWFFYATSFLWKVFPNRLCRCKNCFHFLFLNIIYSIQPRNGRYWTTSVNIWWTSVSLMVWDNMFSERKKSDSHQTSRSRHRRVAAIRCFRF